MKTHIQKLFFKTGFKKLSSLALLLLLALLFTLIVSCECAEVDTNKDKDKDRDNPTVQTEIKITTTLPTDGSTDIPFFPVESVFAFDNNIALNPNHTDSVLTLQSINAETDSQYDFASDDTQIIVVSNLLILKATNTLLPETEYTVTLYKNALVVQDKDSLDTDIFNEEYSFSFTTASSGLPINSSFFSLSAESWYETKSTDDGSFSEVIHLQFPPAMHGILDITSASTVTVSSVFTDLTNQIGSTTTPVAIAGLPDGLNLRLTQQKNADNKTTHIQLQLTGNASAHAKADNTSFTLTLQSALFDVSTDYSSADIVFDFDLVFGEGGFWSGRNLFQAFPYDDKLWVLGGENQNSDKFNDIWTSSNGGTNWSKVTVLGNHWSGRHSHQAFAYDDKLWVLGGQGDGRLNDVWRSSNQGKSWQQVPASGHWSSRLGHQAFAYNDKLWVLGGASHSSFGGWKKDIWTSSDGGSNWSEVTVSEPQWNNRYYHEAFPYDNKLWVLGGGIVNVTNDIWNSSDGGATWSEIAFSEPRWSERTSHQAFVYDDKLWVLGGVDGTTFYNDIWTSADGGATWSQINVSGSHWKARFDYQAFAYDDKLWVLGGTIDNNPISYINDIWYSADHGTNWHEVIPVQFSY